MGTGKWPGIPPEAWQYATMGIELFAIFSTFVAGGLLLDRRLDTRPVFTVVGAVIGFAGGLYRMMRLSRQYRDGDGF